MVLGACLQLFPNLLPRVGNDAPSKPEILEYLDNGVFPKCKRAPKASAAALGSTLFATF